MHAGGGVLPGTNVTATNLTTNITRTTVTSGTGDYTFTLLPLGVYEVKAEHSAPRPSAQRDDAQPQRHSSAQHERTDCVAILSDEGPASSVTGQCEHPDGPAIGHLGKLAGTNAIQLRLHAARVATPPGHHGDVLPAIDHEC